MPGDAHPVPGFAHAAFEHVAHTQLSRYLLHIDGAALVGEGGVAGDDKEPQNRVRNRLSAGERWIRTSGSAYDANAGLRRKSAASAACRRGSSAAAVGGDQFRRKVKSPNRALIARGTGSSNPSPSSREMLWGGRRGWQFRRLHQSMECRDVPAERFEQVPGGAGPR